MKDLYTENCKKQIEDRNKWKDITCSWIRRVNFVKISVLFKAANRLNEIPIKIPTAFFTHTDKQS